MASEVPPLVGAGVDLRDFQFMPLDVVRLRDSDLASNETPEACWAAVLLWSASWHQVPPASVPNDDRWLAKQAGYMSRGRIAKEWATIRSGALRGFVECSDGRLYHPVVAEKAIEAWQSKLERQWRTECARIKKHNQRHGANEALPSYAQWLAHGCPQGLPLPVPGDKKGTGSGRPREKRSKGQVRDRDRDRDRDRELEKQGVASQPVGRSPDAAPAQPVNGKVNGHVNGAELAREARSILATLNEKAGKRFPETDTNVGIIVARMREGFTGNQIRQVVGMKVREWKADPEMREYLRPLTLFGRMKFSQYVGELAAPDDTPDDDAADPGAVDESPERNPDEVTP